MLPQHMNLSLPTNIPTAPAPCAGIQAAAAAALHNAAPLVLLAALLFLALRLLQAWAMLATVVTGMASSLLGLAAVLGLAGKALRAVTGAEELPGAGGWGCCCCC